MRVTLFLSITAKYINKKIQGRHVFGQPDFKPLTESVVGVCFSINLWTCRGLVPLQKYVLFTKSDYKRSLKVHLHHYIQAVFKEGIVLGGILSQKVSYSVKKLLLDAIWHQS